VTGKAWLFLALAAFAAVHLMSWIAAFVARRGMAGDSLRIRPIEVALGFGATFLDTLGIGNFATTTSVLKLRNLVPDRLIPGTLNTAYASGTFIQAFVFIAIVAVEFQTLALMIAASVAGAWLGAGTVATWPQRKVQMGMGTALVAAALLMLMTQLQLVPGGGDTLALTGWRLGAGLAANFALGALMTLGIGLYAPCMILVSLLAMNPTAAFPIMMGSCAFLMPVASLRFMREGSFSLRSALGLLIGSLPGVLLAAFVVKSLPLGAVRWLVIVVVLYAATAMLRSAFADRAADVAVAAPSPS
jgi:uncharacterized membrane protein YfcA